MVAGEGGGGRGGGKGAPRGGRAVCAGGAKGGQQAAEVEAERSGGQQGRLPPVLVQDRLDRVPVGQQPGVQAGERRPPVTRFLRAWAARPAAASGWSVCKTMAPKMATRQNPRGPPPVRYGQARGLRARPPARRGRRRAAPAPPRPP